MKRYLGALVALSALVGSIIAASPAGASTSDEAWEYVSAPVGGSYTPIVGNFDGNGTSDILWYTPNKSADSLWLFHGGSRQTHVNVPESVGSPHIPIVGNFAGDWRDDILWYTPGAAADPLWVASNTSTRFTTRTLQVGGTYKPVVLRDWSDYATHDDIVWYSPSSTSVSIWHFGDTSNTVANPYKSLSFTIPAKSTPVVGDWNVDGIDDLVWYGPGTAGDAKWVSRTDGTFVNTLISAGGAYQPVAVWGTAFDGVTPVGDSILWWGNGAAADSYWSSDGSGFTKRAGATSTASGTPFPLFPGIDLVYEPSGPEQVFVDWGDGGPVSYDAASPSGRDIGAGVKPLAGDFDGDGAPDVFWYGPGTLGDEIWYFSPAVSPALRLDGSKSAARSAGGSTGWLAKAQAAAAEASRTTARR